MNNFSDKPSQKNIRSALDTCKTADELSAILGKTKCSIGTHGGRHFSYASLDSDNSKTYVTFNSIVSTFTGISKNASNGKESYEKIEKLKIRINELDSDGNSALAKATIWQRFGTLWRRFANIRFGFNRKRTLNKAVENCRKAEDQYLIGFVAKIKIEINKSSPFKSNPELKKKIESIESFKVYCHLIELIETELTGISKVKALKNLPVSTSHEKECKKLKVIKLAEAILSLDDVQMNKLLKENEAVKIDITDHFGKTPYVSLSLNWMEEENGWPLNIILNNNITDVQKTKLLEKFATSLQNLLSDTGQMSFAEHCCLKGARDETVIRKLLNFNIRESNIQKLLDKWPNDENSVDIRFHDRLRLERGLRLVTRTMDTGETSKCSAVEDVREIAERWKKQLKTRAPWMKREIAIVNALIMEIDSPMTPEDFKKNAVTTTTPLCLITPNPFHDNDVRNLRMMVVIPSTDKDKPGVKFVEICPGIDRHVSKPQTLKVEEIQEFLTQRLNVPLPNNSEEPMRQIDRVKVINRFMRQFLDDEYPLEQLMLKHQLFKDFRESYPEWLEDPGLLQWGREQLVHLQTTGEKLLISGKDYKKTGHLCSNFRS